MTEQELLDQFTPPSPILVAVRQALLAKLDENIRLSRDTHGKCGHNIEALMYAHFVVRDIIGQDGRIIKSDIAPYMPPPEG